MLEFESGPIADKMYSCYTGSLCMLPITFDLNSLIN